MGHRAPCKRWRVHARDLLPFMQVGNKLVLQLIGVMIFFHCPFGYYSFSLAKIRIGEQFGSCGFMNGILVRRPETFAYYRYGSDLFSTHPTVIQTDKV